MIDIVGKEPGLEMARIADGAFGAAGNVQVLRQDEFDAADGDVPAAGAGVGGDRDGFQAALVLQPVLIHLGQRHGQGHAAVVSPSVNMTMTRALEDAGSKSWDALVNASA